LSRGKEKMSQNEALWQAADASSGQLLSNASDFVGLPNLLLLSNRFGFWRVKASKCSLAASFHAPELEELVRAAQKPSREEPE
jgi:hypothetical protein